jgi:cysteinyl-tRNA synthetase
MRSPRASAATACSFARHWYHSEHLLVDGKKMSKSLGNLYTLDDLQARRASRPMALRYALLSGHPRKQLNFTLDSLHAAESALLGIERYLEKIRLKLGHIAQGEPSSRFDPVINCLRDDLNTPISPRRALHNHQ